MKLLTEAARATARAAEAAQERDEMIRVAVLAGNSMRAVAQACGLSHQRIHQIVRGERAPTR